MQCFAHQWLVGLVGLKNVLVEWGVGAVMAIAFTGLKE